MRTVLVTGANGFIGRHACEWLSQRGWQLRRAVRDSAGATAGDTVALGDLVETNESDLDRALVGCTAVLHLAGRAHVTRETAADPRAAFDRINVHASARLATAAARAGANHFVFASSIGVHGNRSDAPLTEDSPLAPAEPYAESKLAAERALQDIAARTGLQLVVIRPPLVYGPHCPGNMARLIRLIQRGWPLPLASVHARRSLIGVRNLASLMEVALAHDAAAGQVFVAADGEDIGLAQLIRLLAAGLGVGTRLLPTPVPLLRLGARIAGRGATWDRLAGSLLVDAAKARQVLDWHPEVTLAEGLRETALSFRPLVPASGRGTE